MKRLIFCLFIAALLVGCVGQTMQSWVGHTQSELIAAWGPPTSRDFDGSGGTILIYNKSVNIGQQPGYIQPDNMGGYNYTAPQQQTYNKIRMFYVNSQGIIYAYKWQGLSLW
jgi:hypothetical protein